MDKEILKGLANDLGMAAQCLRSAWKAMKHNGMEATAKELADTVLDVEFAAEQANEALSSHCMCAACRVGILHSSDCAVHNEPAYKPGTCDCGANALAQADAASGVSPGAMG